MIGKKRVLATLLVMGATRAHALGLGDITLHSYLNQPLDATVQLLSARPEETSRLTVEVAPASAFARAGLDRPAFLSRIRFNVVSTPDGAEIKVTSKDPVNEPFLDFLLQVVWPGGQMVREYTVLIDPPSLMPAPAPEISTPVVESAPKTSPQSSETVVRPAFTETVIERRVPGQAPEILVPEAAVPRYVPPAEVAPEPKFERTPEPAPAPQSYRIKRNDTLWNIARAVRPGDDISVEQTMVGLLRANPDAFASNNINLLKANRVLQVPARAELTALSRAEAQAEVRAQTRAWRSGLQPAAPIEKPEASVANKAAADVSENPASTVAEPDASPAAPEAPVESRLKLAAPADAPAEDGSGANAGASDVVPAPVATAKIQRDLVLAQEAAETQRRETEEMRTRLTELETQMTSMQRLLELKNSELARLQNVTGVESASDTKSANASLWNNPVVMGLGGAVGLLLLGLGWLLARLRREPSSEPPAMTARSSATDPAFAEAGTAAAAAAATTARSAGAPAGVDSDSGDDSPAALDPIAEADVYLAYGRHQQAADLVQDAVRENPGDEALSVKLLEIHFAARNRTEFDKVAEELSAHMGDSGGATWRQVCEMGREINPDNALYQQGGPDTDVLSVLGVEEEPLETRSSAGSDDDNLLEFESGLAGEPDAEETPAGGDRLSFEFDAPEDADKGELEQELPLARVASSGEGLLSEVDEVGTKLDLARAYVDMGDPDGARTILQEVISEGSDVQKQEAETLISQIS